ncbi:MAG TPA: 4-alpha-glucanotransferase [Aliidongia sp.]|nr:4-alpha-glucanotransferase [Aliidongia sp.]
MIKAETSALDRLAAAVGIEPHYRDTMGVVRETTPETARALLAVLGIGAETEQSAAEALAALQEKASRRLLPPAIVTRPGAAIPLRRTGPVEWSVALETGEMLAGVADGGAIRLPADLAPGYHRLVMEGVEAGVPLIVTPPSAYLPPWLERGERRWGLASPLFSLWTERSQGIGDFSDLADLGREAAALGATVIGLNPLHALFPREPEQANPYWPSSRLYLNPLHLDVTDIDPSFYPSTAPLPWRADVDYSETQARKNAILEALYRRFAEGPPSAEFESYIAWEGERLRRFALFNAIEEKLGPLRWWDWPAELRSPHAAGAERFAQEHRERLRYHAWLQWHAERQLSGAAAALSSRVEDGGLYGDLAVGISPDGADAWADQDVYAAGARFGAPPDGFTPAGQDWGMTPPDPIALAEHGYAPFIAALRANMRHAAILRIDHVMGMARLYWIPPGAAATTGAYIRYPFQDMLGIIALESHRNRCTVIGEDLGTVPEGFRDTLAGAHILSYRVLGFERWDNGLFRRPESYPPLALATSGTHDLPSFAGWWNGDDIALRGRLGLLFSADDSAEHRARQTERELMVAAFADQNLLPPDFPTMAMIDDDRMVELIEAAQRFLARTPTALQVINIADLLLERVQINLPGTVTEHANWRARCRRPVMGLSADPIIQRIVQALRAEGRT